VNEIGAILRLLNQVSKNLLKLEEGWIDRLSKTKTLTNTLQANNINFHIQKCKEHIACILIQILTLSQDHFFILKIGELQKVKVTKSYKKDVSRQIKSELEQGKSIFLDEYQN